MAKTDKNALAVQTLNSILEYLGLPAESTQDDIAVAIAKRDEALIASVRKAPSVKQWTPQIITDGEMKFAGTKVRLAADEVQPLMDMLNSEEFGTWWTDNSSILMDRKDVREARKARRAEAKKKK